MKTKVNRVHFDLALKTNEKDQILWADVMHIDQQHFFVAVCDPLLLLLVCHVANETADALGEALQDFLGVMRERVYTNSGVC